MRKFTKVTSLALALTLLLSACNNDSGSELGSETSGSDTEVEENGGSQEEEEPSDETFDGPLHQDPEEYTFNDYMSTNPKTWNPHIWETNADSFFMDYITTPLVDVVPAEEGDGYERQYAGAESVKDITADFADKEAWGVPEDADKGYVYEINLREGFTWEDGEEINADSHIYGMKQILDPHMKNYRANTYYNGDLEIVGARDYYESDKAGQTKYSPWSADAVEAGEVKEDAKLFFNTDQEIEALGGSIKDNYKDYAAYFKVGDTDIYEKYKDKGTVEVTDEVKADLVGLAKNFGATDPEQDFKEFTLYEDGVYAEGDWDKVGFFKGDNDYQLIWVLENPLSEFYFLNNMTAGWLVQEDKYEAGKKTTGELVATDYNTNVETTASFGPYKLVSFEPNTQIKLERNENWKGYDLDIFDKSYQTDKINIEIVADHNTALQLFNQGKLDTVSLESADLETYGLSDYLMSAEESYTYRFVFATDPDSLAQLQAEAGDNVNKQVLQYDDFRKAMSLSLDRTRIAQETTAGNKPAYFLLNYLYYYDVENDPESIYRNSPQGQAAICKLYGVEWGEGKDYETVEDAYNSITGYDVEAAKELFQSVYEQAIEDGTYKDGEDVVINIMITAASSLTPDQSRQQDLINDLLKEATKGTGFEDKVSVKYQFGSQTYYEDVANGKIEAILGAWGGAAFYPFSTIGVYVNPESVGGLDSIHESNGWNPTTEKLTITYDFDGDGEEEEQTRTFTQWHQSIVGDGDYAGDIDTSLEILSNLEYGVLNTYQNIPLSTSTANRLRSQKVEYYTYEYNIMYGFGGLQLLTYNYNDSEWADYVESEGGTLNYE